MQRRLLIRLTITIVAILLLSLPALAMTETLTELQNMAQTTLENLNPKKILDLFTSNISAFSKSIFANFGICTCVIIISSVFNIIRSGIGSSKNDFDLIACCIIISVIFLPLTSCFEKTAEHIEAVCGFMISLIPTCVMLHTASGNSLSASLMSASTGTVITLIQTISVSLVMPLIKGSLSIATVNTISRNISLTGLSQTLKNISLWITGLCFTLFTGFLSLSSLLQAGADNLTMKGLKYGAAKLIPIAGGLVSESMKTVVTSVGYIKSITGISGIIFIVYAIVPPLCFILLTKLELSVLAIVSDIAQSSIISSFLKFTHSIINILLALLISSSVSLIIILSIFIKTTVAI